MSTAHTKTLSITDESLDSAEFASLPFDEDVDWTDDTDAYLATVKVGAMKVFIHRGDLRELRDFLSGLLEADAQSFDVNEDEEED